PYFDILVRCSKGTYIRNLIDDIGDYLGCGATMSALHRTGTSGLDDYPMYTLNELTEMSEQERFAKLLPMDQAITYMPELQLDDQQALMIKQGQLIEQPKPDGLYRAYQAGCFIGLVDIKEQQAHA